MAFIFCDRKYDDVGLMVRNEKLFFLSPLNKFARSCVKEHLFTKDLGLFHLTLLKTVGSCCSFGFFLFLFLSLILSSFIIYADVHLLLIFSDDITLMILFT